MAGNYGYETILISDATATFDRSWNKMEKSIVQILFIILLWQILKDEFAEIMTTSKLLRMI